MSAAPHAGAETVLHAGCVAWGGRGLLISGASGSGKSGLALSLMAMGCDLVADDRTVILRPGDALLADAPASIAARIEARGLGILRADAVGPVPLALAVDLDRAETARLPPRRSVSHLGIALPLAYGAENRHLAAAILQYLKAGRCA